MRNLYYLLKMVRLSLPYKARKYITVLLFIMLGFFLFKSAYAVYDPNAKHSKWFHDSIVNDPLTKSSVDVKASRTYPVTVTDPVTGAKDTINKTQRTTVKLGASAPAVGKKLLKGGLGGLITQALIGLGITAVDWILDPENNAVKYKDPNSGTGTGTGTVDPTCATYESSGFSSANPLKTCQLTIGESGWWGATKVKYAGLNDRNRESWVCSGVDAPERVLAVVECVGNPSYGKDTDVDADGYKRVPIDTVAQQVIRDADAGSPAAQQVMSDTALDMLEAGLLDAQLEAAADPKEFGANQSDPLGGSSPTPDPTPDPMPDPTPDPTPEGEGFQLPPFCDWASKVCEFIDWVKTEPTEPPDGAGDIPIEKPDPDMHVGILERLYINMPAECPPDPVLEFMGAKIPFPMSVFCQFASMMKPLILLFAYIKGLSIIGNGLT